MKSAPKTSPEAKQTNNRVNRKQIICGMKKRCTIRNPYLGLINQRDKIKKSTTNLSYQTEHLTCAPLSRTVSIQTHSLSLNSEVV
jgi:hypothetical protein